MNINKILLEYKLTISSVDNIHNVNPISDNFITKCCVCLDNIDNFPPHNIHDGSLYQRTSGPLKNKYYYIFKTLSGRCIGMFFKEDFDILRKVIK